MGNCLLTFAVLCAGCGGVASTQSEAASQPSSDDSPCAVTDGSIEAAWGGTTLTLTGSCSGAPGLYYVGSSAFELCAHDGSGLQLVLGQDAPPEGEWAQIFDYGTASPWVANSRAGFTLTVTAMRPPGHYVEGRFTGLVGHDTWTGAPTEPAKTLSGSFKMCRAPDEPPPK